MAAAAAGKMPAEGVAFQAAFSRPELRAAMNGAVGEKRRRMAKLLERILPAACARCVGASSCGWDGRRGSGILVRACEGGCLGARAQVQ